MNFIYRVTELYFKYQYWHGWIRRCSSCCCKKQPHGFVTIFSYSMCTISMAIFVKIFIVCFVDVCCCRLGKIEPPTDVDSEIFSINMLECDFELHALLKVEYFYIFIRLLNPIIQKHTSTQCSSRIGKHKINHRPKSINNKHSRSLSLIDIWVS